METNDKEDIKDILDEALEIKKELNLESLDTALLIMIHQGIDVIRFHNTD